MPSKILILFAHPAFQRSRVHRVLVGAARGLEGVTLHDLYETYPDLMIDVRREQALLRDHDILVFQHPFYWYSSPAILKEWLDLVLEHGFAYGRDGTALRGKALMSAVSTGGGEAGYRSDGTHRFTVAELLRPFEQTAVLCGIRWLPPFVVHGTHLLQADAIRRHGEDYRRVLIALRDGVLDAGSKALSGLPRINADLAGIGV